MKYAKYAILAITFAGVVLVSACTRSISHIDSQGKTDNPIFPDASHAVRGEGSFVNVDNLQKMRPGLTKEQVYELIGTPHFNEGVFRVREWDYIFHFIRTDGSVYTCQYKVIFDLSMQARSFVFSPAGCLGELKPVDAKMNPGKSINKILNAAGLFDFGSVVLSYAGVVQINSLAEEIKGMNFSSKKIIISGYTDRIGSQIQNKQLSLARAESVKHILVQRGIPPSIITTRGMGDSLPRVLCPGKKSTAIITCLAPNRRISVEVINSSASI